MTAQEDIRAFVALEVSEESREALMRVQDRLRAASREVKWVAPQNLHLTLIFLGGVPHALIDPISEALEAACRPHAPFPLTIHGVGAFPNARKPKTVWAGLAGDLAPLRALVESVDRAMAEHGYAPDKAFKPHITLGRSRSDSGDRMLADVLPALKDEPVSSFRAEEVTLFRSDLRSQGPIYTPLAHFPLACRME